MGWNARWDAPLPTKDVAKMAEILRFPDRGLLKLIGAVNGVLNGTYEPTKALELAETVLRDVGAVKDEKGEWYLPPGLPDQLP
jgi:hypothetical protein